MLPEFIASKAAVAASHLLPVAEGRGRVCPVAPEGAQGLVDQILGWVSWALVWVAFPAGILLSVGGILIGKWVSHQGAAKAGVIGLFVVIGAAILYLVMPGIVAGFLGDGCVQR